MGGMGGMGGMGRDGPGWAGMGRDGLLVPQAVEFNFRRYKPLDSDPSPL